MSRLVAFGCSFTNYHWSTWADILAPVFDTMENWAAAGAGNHFIFNAVMEADQRQRFGPGDTVIVCWSNVMREDRYLDDRGWVTLGNLAHSNIYTKEFVANAVSQRGFMIRDLAMIKAVKTLLESRPGVVWKFVSICPIDQRDNYDDTKFNWPDVFALYRDVIESMGISYQDVLGTNWWLHNPEHRFRQDQAVDYHPTPLEHLTFVESAFPEYPVSDIVRHDLALESQNLKKTRPGGPIVPRL